MGWEVKVCKLTRINALASRTRPGAVAALRCGFEVPSTYLAFTIAAAAEATKNGRWGGAKVSGTGGPHCGLP